MDYIYKSEFLHNLANHKEFTSSYSNVSLFRNLCLLCYIGIALWFIRHFSIPTAVYYYLFFAVIYLIIRLVTNPRNGDIQYKRVLQGNGGKPVHQVQYFTQTGVHCVNRDNGNQADFTYDLFRYAIESRHLLILVLQHRSCLILEKQSLEGCSPQELLVFLKERNPKFKGKRYRNPHLGRWLQRIFALILAAGSIWALLNFPGFSLADRITGRLSNNMTYQEMADKLAAVDIHITDRTIQELDAYDSEYFHENEESFYDGAFKEQKVTDLLYWEGCGVYSEDGDIWTPSVSGIYWQEYEVWNVDSIYTDFLTGLSALDPELNFTDIQETLSTDAVSNGIGTSTITFQWQGQSITLEAEYFYDRFDTAIVSDLGKIVNNGDKKLYVCYDQDSGALFYYGTGEQIRTLKKLTGLKFQDTAKRAW